MALIVLVYAVVDGEGDVLHCQTWTSGRTVEAARRQWCRRHPAAAAALVEEAVITTGRGTPYQSQQLLGERVPVPELLLADAAKNLRAPMLQR